MEKVLYFIEENYSAKSVFKDREELIYSVDSYLKELLERYFIEKITYNKCCQKYLNFKYNIPIYLSKSIILIHCKNETQDMYINYSEILGVYSNGKTVKVLFNGNKALIFDYKMYKLDRSFKKCIALVDYMRDLYEC